MKFGLLDADVAKDRDLAPAAKIVYAVLRGIRNDKTGQCNPSRATIAEMSGLHIKSVGRAIGQLKGQYLQIIDGNYAFDREQIVPSEGTNCSIEREQIAPSKGTNCSLEEDKLLPQKEQIVPSLIKDDKNFEKNSEKNFEKRDSDFIKPDPDQQQIAEDLVARWDAKYSHTQILSDMVGDRMAFIKLQTIHNQSRKDIEQVIDASGESIKFWPRPKNLINRIGNDDDKPMVWQKIKSDAMFQPKPQPQTRTPKRKIAQQYLDHFARIEAGFQQ